MYLYSVTNSMSIIMHKIVLSTILLACISLIPCQAQENNDTRPTSYVVEGRLAGTAADGMKIHLYETEARRNVNTAVVTGDKFRFTGVADSAIECRVIIREYQMEGYMGEFILENGHIRMDLGKSRHAPTGTQLNDVFRKIYALEDSLKKTNAPEKAYKTYSKQVFKGHENDAIGYSLLGSLFFTYAGTNQEKLTLLQSLGPNLKRTGNYQFRLSYCQPSELIGQRFKEVKGTDVHGDSIALSDFIGKGNYVLIDMWASWCKPCKGEVPFLKQLHGQFKDKGLTIVGIFTWDKAENLDKAMKENSMTWPQLIDLDKTAMTQYQAAGIPTMVLLSPDGTILEIDSKFRGENMVQIVRGYIEKESVPTLP